MGRLYLLHASLLSYLTSPRDPIALNLWKEVVVILGGFGLVGLKTWKTRSPLMAGRGAEKSCQQSVSAQALCQLCGDTLCVLLVKARGGMGVHRGVSTDVQGYCLNPSIYLHAYARPVVRFN